MLTSCRGLKNKGYSASFVTTSLGRGGSPVQPRSGCYVSSSASRLHSTSCGTITKIAQWFRRSFEHQPAAVTFVEQVDADLTTIYTGNLITIGASGLLAVSTYYVLDIIAPAGTGVQFPFLLGLLTGVATLIPAIGMKLIYYPYTGYLVWQVVSKGEGSLWFPVVFFLVTVVVVDVIPDFFIRSYVSKGELNMGLLLLTYVLGVVAFGWYGVFFAPIVLVVFIHFVRDILPVLLGSDATTR